MFQQINNVVLYFAIFQSLWNHFVFQLMHCNHPNSLNLCLNTTSADFTDSHAVGQSRFCLACVKTCRQMTGGNSFSQDVMCQAKGWCNGMHYCVLISQKSRFYGVFYCVLCFSAKIVIALQHTKKTICREILFMPLAVVFSLIKTAWVGWHLCNVLQLRDVCKWKSVETRAHQASRAEKADKSKNKWLMNNS